MKIRIVLTLAALTLAGLAVGIQPAGAATNGVADPSFDNASGYDSRGDIISAAVDYEDDLAVFAVKRRTHDNPYDFNWSAYFTGPVWYVGTDADDTYDVEVYFANFGDELHVWASDSDTGTILCQGTSDYDADGFLFAGISASCLGNPSSLRVRPAMIYSTASTTSVDWTNDFSVSRTTTPATPPPAPPTTQPTPQPAPQPQPNPPFSGAEVKSGYAMVTSDGDIHRFGDAPFCNNAPGWNDQDTMDIDVTPDGKGYWVLQAHGFVTFIDCGIATTDYIAYETNNFVALNPGEKAVSLSALPDGTGYWVFTDRGRALNFGAAQHLGDMGATRLNAPVLDSVATPTGKGYWMVAADGGIFTFGDARFSGSTGDIRLNKPVMSMAPDPDGSGYWLVASDGGIFAFDAPFYGSMGASRLNKPVSGIVPGSAGYMMVAEDGGIFSFGNVAFHGSLGATPPPHPVVAVTLLP